MGRKLSGVLEFFLLVSQARNGVDSHTLSIQQQQHSFTAQSQERVCDVSENGAAKPCWLLNSWILLNPLQFDLLLWLDASEGNRLWDTSYQGLSIVYANMNQTQQGRDSHLHTTALPLCASYFFVPRFRRITFHSTISSTLMQWFCEQASFTSTSWSSQEKITTEGKKKTYHNLYSVALTNTAFPGIKSMEAQKSLSVSLPLGKVVQERARSG